MYKSLTKPIDLFQAPFTILRHFVEFVMLQATKLDSFYKQSLSVEMFNQTISETGFDLLHDEICIQWHYRERDLFWTKRVLTTTSR